MKRLYDSAENNKDKMNYYIDWRFAWSPTFCDGKVVWLWIYWAVWPEDYNENKVEFLEHFYHKDPRKK